MENTSVPLGPDLLHGAGASLAPNCSQDGEAGPAAVKLLSIDFIAPIAVLTIFNLVVIIGNSLVITAVFTHTKLRTATNMFIVSLAVADLMLGIIVLPYSSAIEVLRGYWPFGFLWCRVWLAVDVWLCTASILNLCAISLDRYLAITRPFKYPRLMSPLRAKLLVGVVWIASFIVCFPPLVGWNEQGTGLGESQSETDSNTVGVAVATTASILTVIITSNNGSGSTGQPMAPQYTNIHVPINESVVSDFERAAYNTQSCNQPLPTCNLEAEAGYRIYSAFGSFWVPVWIMVFFYWRIYRTAANATTAFRRGVLTTKTGDLSSSSPDTQVTLRVHRGGGASKRYTTEENPSTRLLKSQRSLSTAQAPTSPIRSTPPTPSPTELSRPFTGNNPDHNRRKQVRRKPPKIKITFSKNCDDLNGTSSHGKAMSLQPERRLKRSQSTPTSRPPPPLSPIQNGTRKHPIPECPGTYSTGESSTVIQDDASSGTSSKASILHKMGGRVQVKTHIKRLNKEKKAAKTVGIIVGCFIICWAPFFTVYLIDAFCNNCTPGLLFTIFFWLGYCNSAVNPCIYALCSRDFRYAFKKLLRCRCERTRPLRERRNTRFLSLLNSLRIKISSKESESNSEQNEP